MFPTTMESVTYGMCQDLLMYPASRHRKQLACPAIGSIAIQLQVAILARSSREMSQTVRIN